jgi:hypothetical protein
MKQYFKFDKDGYYIEPVIFIFTTTTDEDENVLEQITDIFGNKIEKIPDNVTEIHPCGLWRAKFTGKKWIETGEPPVVEEVQVVPTIEQRLAACEAAILEVAEQLPANARGLAAVSALQAMIESEEIKNEIFF